MQTLPVNAFKANNSEFFTPCNVNCMQCMLFFYPFGRSYHRVPERMFVYLILLFVILFNSNLCFCCPVWIKLIEMNCYFGSRCSKQCNFVRGVTGMYDYLQLLFLCVCVLVTTKKLVYFILFIIVFHSMFAWGNILFEFNLVSKLVNK